MNQTNITALDGASTPVSHTFTAQAASLTINKDGSMDGVAYWREAVGSSPAAANTLTLRSTFPNPGKASAFVVHRVTIKLPTMQVVGIADSGVTPPQEVAWFNQYKFESRVSQRTGVPGIAASALFAANVIAALSAVTTGVGTQSLSLNAPYN